MLEVSRSGYDKWKNAGESERERRYKRLLQIIRKIFEDSWKTYGVRRVHQELRNNNEPVNRKLVERIMRENGIRPKRNRPFKLTTDSKHSLPRSPNNLAQRFNVNRPNGVWVTDITYVETGEGWLYLCAFIDLYSRKVVGWSMSERMTADLVVNAYRMSTERRGVRAPLIVHSDQGSQYASAEFRQQLRCCLQSMSRKGNCWDNAVAESFFGALKSELIYRYRWDTREEAASAIFEYIEIFYNKKRLHSKLGYVSPEEFEEKDKKAA